MIEKYEEIIADNGDNFTKEEFVTDDRSAITDMDTCFLESFVKWRQWHTIPTLITSAYRPDDPNSHGRGEALDCILFTDWRNEFVPPRRQWLLATTWRFWGVGIYFDWHFYDLNRQRKDVIGLHCDRFTRKGEDRPLRWLRTDGVYYYQSTKNGIFYSQDGASTTLEEQIERFHDTS